MAGFNRRQLFRLKIGDLNRELDKVFSSPSRGTDAGTETEAKDELEWFPRPPGAISEEQEFLDTCERCHACAGACPYEAISTYGPAMGKLEGTPFIDPAKSPCHWCEDMPCLKACPSGALQEPLRPIARISLVQARVSPATISGWAAMAWVRRAAALERVSLRVWADAKNAMDRARPCNVLAKFGAEQPSMPYIGDISWVVSSNAALQACCTGWSMAV